MITAAAEDQLGVDPWDRPAIFTESADAATERAPDDSIALLETAYWMRTYGDGPATWRPAPRLPTTPWAMKLFWNRVVQALALSPAAHNPRAPGSALVSFQEAGARTAFPRTDHRQP